MTEMINILFSPKNFKVLSFISGFLAVFLLTLHLLPDERLAEAKRRLGVGEFGQRPNQVPLLRLFRPFCMLLAPSFSMKPRWDEDRKKFQKRLVAADLRDEILPDEFIAFRFVMAVFFPLFMAFGMGAIGMGLTWYYWPIVIVIGYFMPSFWLADRLKARRRAIIRALPYTLDLLTLSVEAGLDFIAAIQRLIQRTKENALLREFNYMLKEIRLGTARSDALRNMSDRLQVEEITSFTTLLIQADQLGASVGQVLRAQSDQLRSQRFQTAETAGARASQLVLFPVVLFIFPAIFIVVVGPTLLNFLSKGFF